MREAPPGFDLRQGPVVVAGVVAVVVAVVVAGVVAGVVDGRVSSLLIATAGHVLADG